MVMLFLLIVTLVLSAAEEENLMLSCSMSVNGATHGSTVQAMGLTVQQQRDLWHSPYGFSLQPPYSRFAYGFNKALAMTEELRLNATLILFSTTGSSMDVIITENGFIRGAEITGEGCIDKDFGDGLFPPREKDMSAGFSADGKFPSGGTVYPAPVVFGAASPGYTNVAPAGFASHFPQYPLPTDLSGQAGIEDQLGPGQGVIFRGNISASTLLISQLDSLGPFRRLSDLAGRSIIVCTEAAVGVLGQARCRGQILACCTLGYGTRIRPIRLVTPSAILTY